MSAKLACSALVLAILAVACTPAAAHDHHGPEVYDCQGRFGAACTNCVNVTVASSHNRRLLGRGNRQGGNRAYGYDRMPTNRTILACTACDGAPNFVLNEKAQWTNANGGIQAGECSKF